MNANLDPPTCDACYGRRFVRSVAGVWEPCTSCFWVVVSRHYVQAVVKQTDTQLPAEWLQQEPWPLTDRQETGNYHDFRYMVWRSLLHYYGQRLTYDYFEAWRLTEIQFERDAGDYKSLRDLKDLGLLVLIVGRADPPNSYTEPLVRYVVNLRQMHGRPTWVYKSAGPSAPSLPAPRPSLGPPRLPAPPGKPVKERWRY